MTREAHRARNSVQGEKERVRATQAVRNHFSDVSQQAGKTEQRWTSTRQLDELVERVVKAQCVVWTNEIQGTNENWGLGLM